MPEREDCMSDSLFFPAVSAGLLNGITTSALLQQQHCHKATSS